MSKDRAIGIQAKKEKSKKKFRRVFSLLVKHKNSNRDIKKKKNSKSGLHLATHELRNEVHRAGKTIAGLDVSPSTKRQALRRLYRLHRANAPHVRGTAAKKEEQKK